MSAALQEFTEILLVDVDPTLSRATCWNSSGQTTCKFLQVWNVVDGSVQGHETNAAIDVKTHAPRRDRSTEFACFGVGGHDTTDGKAVAVMPVSHGPRFTYDARECSGVDELFWTPVVGVSLHVRSIGDQSSIGLHHPVRFDAHGAVAFIHEMVSPRRLHGWVSSPLQFESFCVALTHRFSTALK